MFFRHWLPALAIAAAVIALILQTWRRTTEPEMLRSAAEELLADLQEAVAEREALFHAGGLWPVEGKDDPPTKALPAVEDPELFVWQLTRSRAAAGQPLGGFLKGRSAILQGGNFRDAWGHPIRHEIVDGKYRAVSAGPDGVFDTADDMSSENARSRHHATPRTRKLSPAQSSGAEPRRPAAGKP